MGKCYSHLSVIKRSILKKMLEQGVKKVDIARHLGVHVSTIYREIKRNTYTEKQSYKTISYYCSYFAQKKYINRRQRESKLSGNKALREFVFSKLRASWSPWQIEWQLKYDEPDLPSLSHETIYRYIYSHWKNRYQFTPYLRRKHRTRVKRSQKKQRIMSKYHISLRPESVNNRQDFGHWECDLMHFQKGTKTNLITLVERKSRFLIAIKNENKQARPTALAIINALKKLKKHVSSITFDQGSEFYDFGIISSCLGSKVYFCSPGSPEEKGAIENRNGVLRTLYPRSCDISHISQSDIDAALSSINMRPMMCLDYKSPQKVFNSQREFSDELSIEYSSRASKNITAGR